MPSLGTARGDGDGLGGARGARRRRGAPRVTAGAAVFWGSLVLPAAGQLELFRQRGGKRPRAGRKAVVDGRVTHRARPDHPGRFPVHVTLRVLEGIPRLRDRHLYAVLRGAFRSGADRGTFRLVHYSVQSNHLHLICEANDKRSLSRGLQGLAIRIARSLNKRIVRRGKVFADRYHATELRNPLQTRRALVYVINNFLKHERGLERIHGPVDPFSSAAHFEGWRYRLPPFVRIDAGARVCPAPRTWLLTTGWTRHGTVRFGEAPS